MNGERAKLDKFEKAVYIASEVINDSTELVVDAGMGAIGGSLLARILIPKYGKAVLFCSVVAVSLAAWEVSGKITKPFKEFVTGLSVDICAQHRIKKSKEEEQDGGESEED